MGGTAKLAYDKLKELGGMPSEWTYPYTSGNFGAAEYCHGTPLVPAAPHFGRVSKAVNVTGMTAVTSNDYAAVMTAIATVGPMTITVDAGGWHDYAEGVFTGGNHTNPDLDHLVQLVGYGTDPKLGDYWLVRNSWTCKLLASC
jgi:cathepsin L